MEWDDDIFKNKLKKNHAHTEREREREILADPFNRTQTHRGLTGKIKSNKKTHATAAFDVIFLFAPMRKRSWFRILADSLSLFRLCKVWIGMVIYVFYDGFIAGLVVRGVGSE